MSGLFGGTTIPGNRITDFAKQTATVGTPIPFGYGKFPVTSTNVIWIDKVVEHVTKKKQGKGGVKTEEYTYTRSYAIGVCQGPVYGFLIVRRNGKVVYTEDANAPVEDKDYAAKWRQNVQFYFGTRDQMPDSTIEAVEGAGQVSAFRDVAYFVVENDDVTDGAGAVPSYEVVVMGTLPEVYLTSRPYPVELTDALGDRIMSVRSLFWQRPLDAVQSQSSVISGTLHQIVRAYIAPAEDALIDNGAVPISGTLHQIVKTYIVKTYVAPVEDALVDNGAVPMSGMLRQIVQSYTMPPKDAFSDSATIVSGSLQ